LRACKELQKNLGKNCLPVKTYKILGEKLGLKIQKKIRNILGWLVGITRKKWWFLL